MPELDINTLKPRVSERIGPFFEDLLSRFKEKIHSLHVVGSALTEDFNPDTSDVNSVMVLNEMDLSVLEHLAPLGKSYGKKKIAAPLIMTPKYIASSLDVFPIEFLNFRLIHQTVYGEDLLAGVKIDPENLRHQCERELKVKLIGLRQGYISSQGDRKALAEHFTSSISGYMPLFRGVISLMGGEPPTGGQDVLAALREVSGVDTSAFERVLSDRTKKVKHTIEELNSMFEDYYAATEALSEKVDAIEA